MSALIEDLKAHGTVVDGTFALWLRAPSQGASIGQAVGVPATSDSARVMKEERDYGSVAPGKVADLVIVNGRPSERVADLRKVERVLRAGRVYEARTIQAALREPSR